MSDINMLEVTDKEIKGDSSFTSNQLKTKNVSFDNIKMHWEEYRKNIEDDLEKEKDDLVSREYSFETPKEAENSVENISRLTEKIAMLEAAVKSFEGQNTYESVENRAIKLRNNMFEQLVKNSGGLYSVPEEKTEEVFEEEVKEDTISSFPGDITGDSFESNDIDVEQVVEDNQEQITEDVNNAMNDEISVDSGFEPEAQDMNEVAANIEAEEPIGYDDIKNEIEDALSNLDVEEEIKEEPVSHRRYSYEPMSEQEIDDARERIGINIPETQFENKFRPATNEVSIEEEPIREVPIVAEDREEKQHLNFDYSNATANDINNIIENENVGSDKLRELREKISAMQGEIENNKKQEIKERDEVKNRENELQKIKLERATDIADAKVASEEVLIKAAEEAYKKLSEQNNAVIKSINGFINKQTDVQNEIDNVEKETEEELQRIMDDTERQREEFASMIDTGTVSIGEKSR